MSMATQFRYYNLYTSYIHDQKGTWAQAPGPGWLKLLHSINLSLYQQQLSPIELLQIYSF